MSVDASPDRRIDARDTGPATGPERPSPRSGDPAIPPTGRLLGVDWGEKRIGLAITDPTRTIAQPLATLRRRAGRRFPMRQLRPYL
jgi:Holliday junction resolvase